MSVHRRLAERWLECEPDADVREELRDLLASTDDEIEARFAHGLAFGTRITGAHRCRTFAHESTRGSSGCGGVGGLPDRDGSGSDRDGTFDRT